MRLSRIAASFVALAIIFLPIQPSLAAYLLFSRDGTGTACTQSAPCSFLDTLNFARSFEEIACADGSDAVISHVTSVVITVSVTIDCAGTAGSIPPLTIDNGALVTLRNFTMFLSGNAITLINGTLILDNVHIFNSSAAIVAQPTAPSSLIVRNSVFDNNASGVLLKPAGARMSAVFDHVTIANNLGGGIKIDTSNGSVTMDITDSVVSNNGGNGINAVGPTNLNMVSIKNSVITKNGVVGVQANGALAAVLVQTTLFDQNGMGATSAIGGGRVLTYGNNSIVGIPGSGFTGPAALQ
jgi:Right handed beta helix region